MVSAFLGLAERSWPVLNRLVGGHANAYRLTRGAVGHRIPGLPPFLLLEHTGARSGRRRVTPLVYLTEGDGYAVIASKGGHPRHPAWLHNLRAQPDVTVQVGSRRIDVRAREAEGEERERLWARAVEAYGPYADYQARTERRIPVVVLEPR